MIVFENTGEIDTRLITTMGVNVKDNGKAVGFFGTGLKYALAVLLREHQRIVIQRGTERLEFGLTAECIRGKTFSIVTMNNAPLGFTSEMGKNWSLADAYRELHCNAQDEGGHTFTCAEEPEPEAGITRVCVTGRSFEHTHSERYGILLDPTRQPVWTSPTISALERSPDELKGTVFYQGVRIHRTDRPALFDYNISVALRLTEDRTMAEPWRIATILAPALLRDPNADPGVLQQILGADSTMFEALLDFEAVGTPSPAFLEAVESLRKRHRRINQSALGVWVKAKGVSQAPAQCHLTAVQQRSLQKATAFCVNLGFDVTRFPIVVTEDLPTATLGKAEHGTIYINKLVFGEGTKRLGATILEEFFHLEHGFLDTSRNFQQFLLDTIMSIGEQVVGEAL